MRMSLVICVTTMVVTAPAAADISVRFLEGAPTDRFVFEAIGPCPVADAQLTVDLAGSGAGLIFDVTGGGQGVEVFQPFTLVVGADLVTSTSSVTDGDRALSLDVSSLPPGAEVAFTIDVDDTIGAREITVSGTEIAGAEARLTVNGQTFSAAFGPDARAVILHNACTS